MDVSAVFHQELDAVQVSRQHGFVQRCHACRDKGLALPGKGSLSMLHSQLRKGVLALSFSGRGRWGKKQTEKARGAAVGSMNTLSGRVQHPLPQLGRTEEGSCPLEQLL